MAKPDTTSTRDDRQSRLLGLVMEQQRVEVQELAAVLAVSQVTVRKDLDELAERGLLRREHGFAVAGSASDMRAHLAYHFDAKQRIATAAAATVSDGETVLIESGSVCALLAEALCAEPRGITIVTNSAFIADYVRRSPHGEVVLLGGAYQRESQVLVGPIVGLSVASFLVNQLFIGIDGYAPEAGFLGADVMRAEAVRTMSAQAHRTIVLSESQKFPRRASVKLLPASAVSTVFTDPDLDEAMHTSLIEAGITVVPVPAPAG
ncbi:MAG: DeoR/GlpR family DNA-binding transcription regulator [Propioniciclava sp.]